MHFSSKQIEELNALADNWLHTAKCKFSSAEKEPLEMGKRLINHGAINLFNCARELKKLANSDSFFDCHS